MQETRRGRADLFWESLVGESRLRAPRSFRGAPPVEDLPDEAIAAGLTASPCDIAKTSETLDAFVLDSAVLTAAHRPIVNRIADCIIALRANARPIREIDIRGFTDPSGTETHNEGLGRRRAEAVRTALMAALDTRVPNFAETICFRIGSRGEREQIAGGDAANRRVEVFCRIAVSEIVAHASDPDTQLIPSNLGCAGQTHLCCVKHAANSVVLEARISPNIVGNASTRLTWAATGTAPTVPGVGTDARTARISRAVSGRFPVSVSWDGAVQRSAVVWVIWSNITVTATRAVTTTSTAIDRAVTAGIDHRFTITPATIITAADRPVLEGPKTAPTPGAALRHVVSNNVLNGGALHKWDASRQIRVKVLNPRLYTVAQLVPITGHFWTGQPTASTIPENYPANDALGNDDGGVGDPEDNDPYTAPDVGAVTGTDDPQMVMPHATGADGDSFEMRLHFREFMRVNLNNRWFRCSDFSLWRMHARFLRVAGAWTNNASTFAQDNAGF
jgi:outer membrane protein OmpA-like peptidoglycan-associated protein